MYPVCVCWVLVRSFSHPANPKIGCQRSLQTKPCLYISGNPNLAHISGQRKYFVFLAYTPVPFFTVCQFPLHHEVTPASGDSWRPNVLHVHVFLTFWFEPPHPSVLVFRGERRAPDCRLIVSDSFGFFCSLALLTLGVHFISAHTPFQGRLACDHGNWPRQVG